MIMSEYLDQYTSLRAAALAARTIEGERRMTRLYVVPAIGDTPVSRVTAVQIADLLNNISASGHTRTACAVYTFLRSSARKNGHLHAIMEQIERPKHQSKPINYLTADEAARLITHADPAWRPVWLLALTLGLRRGELAGLRWQDVDDAAGIIHIRNQRQRIGGKIVDSTPKSASGTRDLPLLPIIEDALQPLHTMHQLRPTSEYVFGGISPSSINGALRRDLRALGIRSVTVHGLRHTMAALSVTHQQSVRVLQAVLGHADVSTTSRIYAHVDMQPMTALCATVAQTIA